MADDNVKPPLPKIRDDGYTELLSKKGEKDYRPFFTPSESNSPIFDNEGASSMAKENAPENMKNTLTLLDKLQDKFYKKHKIKIVVNDAIAKEGTSREKKTPGSEHFSGKALDLSTSNLSEEQKDDLAYFSLEVGFKGLGFGSSILHVDTGKQRAWKYSSETFGTKSANEWISIAKTYDHSVSKSRDGKGKSTNEDQDYPVLTERTEQLKGEVAGGFVNLAANMFPDFAASNIISQFPESIRDLPQASRIASEIVQSIQTGQGVQTFTSAIEKISSAERGTARIQAIGSIATENEQLIKALVPSLEQIDFAEAVSFLEGFDEKSPSQRLVSGLRMMETMEPDKLMTVGDVLGLGTVFIERNYNVENFKDQPLSTLFDVNKLSEQGKTTFAPYKNIPISTFEANPESPTAKLGLLGKALYGTKEDQAKALEYLTKGQLPDIPGLEESLPTLFSGSLEDIAQTSLVTEQLGNLPERVLTAERPREIETSLTRFASDIIYEESGGEIGRDTSKTLLAGGTEEEAKQMRQTIGGMALDSFIESNPTLAGIIKWFTENKELVTLLGTAGSLAGLSGILGGGALGGFAAGAGGLAGVRMVLGKEGYEEFQGMIKEGAAPVFDFLGEALESSGLGEIPIIGDILKGTVGIGQENPLAATAALTGNFAMAAGLIAGEEGINVLEGESQVTDMIENLSKVFEVGNRNTQVTQDIAQQGDSPKPNLPTPMGSPDGQRATQQGSPVIGSASGLNPFKLTNNLIDYGRTGVGNISGVQ